MSDGCQNYDPGQKLFKRTPMAVNYAGEAYAAECVEKLTKMASFCPTGVLASNVSSHLHSCADSIRDEIEYLRKRGIT